MCSFMVPTYVRAQFLLLSIRSTCLRASCRHFRALRPGFVGTADKEAQEGKDLSSHADKPLVFVATP